MRKETKELTKDCLQVDILENAILMTAVTKMIKKEFKNDPHTCIEVRQCGNYLFDYFPKSDRISIAEEVK